MSYSVSINQIGAFDDWREKARIAISNGIAPELIAWNDGADLFGGQPLPTVTDKHELRVPSYFFDLSRSVIWHSAPERYSLLYRSLWRLSQRDGQPLSSVDVLGARLHKMAKSVRRDIHKMHAFVRFRELPQEGTRRRFTAWFEPEHFITEPASSFFAKRFADMDWVITTPSICASYSGDKVILTPYDGKPIISEDDTEALWGTYFTNIFNPARIKLNAMRSEMPMKYWKNMPETALIPEMLAKAEERVQQMREYAPSVPRPGAQRVSDRYRSAMPQAIDLPKDETSLNIALQKCRRCNLCDMATRAVPGNGDLNAQIMLVGEQPGDREDLEGKPFVGPAGMVLRQAMKDVGLNEKALWLTNAVKHFKFKIRGKKRIHDSPNRYEIEQCRWWLEAERRILKPKIIVGLGATASFSLTGKAIKQSERRGSIERLEDETWLVHSWHPSFALRSDSAGMQHQIQQDIREDLILAVNLQMETHM